MGTIAQYEQAKIDKNNKGLGGLLNVAGGAIMGGIKGGPAGALVGGGMALLGNMTGQKTSATDVQSALSKFNAWKLKQNSISPPTPYSGFDVGGTPW
jgi:hypothetical protein